MATIPDKIETWQMVQPTAKNKETGEVTPGKLAKTSIPVPALGPGEVLVKVAGCGDDPLSSIQKGRPSARGQCHHHWRHRWGRCLYGSNDESPGCENGHRY